MLLATRSSAYTLSCTILLLSSLHGSVIAKQLSAQPSSRDDALTDFFGSIDKNGDGQIQPSEALQYIGASFDGQDIKVSPASAAQQMSQSLDGSGPDATVSQEEVEIHLKRKLLKASWTP